jgi:UDP-glucose 4-epimerase
MRGKRVLISGMGSELGSLVASLLEAEPWVGELSGIDIDPPRRRLRKSAFHRIEPHERSRMVDVVTEFDPHVLIHLAVWEPDARASTRHAKRLTDEYAAAIFGAARECPSLRQIVVRSAAEAYGRGRDAPPEPDESVKLQPTSSFGEMAVQIEQAASELGADRGFDVGILRLAPVLGPHVPSPLGRLLRLPVVPYNLLGNPAFAVVRDTDAASAFVAAARVGLNEALNIVADGDISAWQALRRGNRVPLPLVGPEWSLIRRLSTVAGAPVPDHVSELLTHGRLVNGERARTVLGFRPQHSTVDVIDRLYAWPAVVRVTKPLLKAVPQQGAA